MYAPLGIGSFAVVTSVLAGAAVLGAGATLWAVRAARAQPL